MFASLSPEVRDRETGVSEGNPMEKRKTRLINQPIQKEQHRTNAQIQQLAKIVARPERQQITSQCCTSKMPKALTVYLPVFGGKAKKFDHFECLFNRSLKMYPHLTEEEKVKHFHTLMRGDALQTLVDILYPQKTTNNNVLAVNRSRFVGTKSMATAKTRWQSLMFDPTKQKLHGFSDDFQRTKVPRIVDQFIYPKLQPNLMRTINLAYPENGNYEQIVNR